MVAAVFGIILAFITGMFLVATEYVEWMWWPIMFSFCCLAVLHTVPQVHKMVKDGEEAEPKKKWVKLATIIGPYAVAIILSLIAGALGISNAPDFSDYDDYGEAYEEEAP